MLLDATTLALAGGFVTSLSGVFLLMYWWQDRKAWAAFWWALGNCTMGIGIIMLALHSVLPFLISDILAPLLLDVSAALAFVAARIFNRGSINPYYVIPAVTAWVAVTAATGAVAPQQFAATLGVATSSGLYAAAALEFWLGRNEPLRGRRPIIGIIIVFAFTLLLLALHYALAVEFNPIPAISSLTIVQVVGFAYTLGVTLFLIIMLKNRNEEKHKNAALTDPLTGLANRRGFMDHAQAILDRAGHDRSPVALLMFDLDRFKLINDTFGHAAGDDVLRVFAEVLSGMLRSTNITARIGGEEFAALVPGAGNDIGLAIASRVCDAFQQAGRSVAGRKIEATVSVGVATTSAAACAIADLLASADVALYRAKRSGRNQVVLAGSEAIDSPVSNVVRIA